MRECVCVSVLHEWGITSHINHFSLTNIGSELLKTFNRFFQANQFLCSYNMTFIYWSLEIKQWRRFVMLQLDFFFSNAVWLLANQFFIVFGFFEYNIRCITSVCVCDCACCSGILSTYVSEEMHVHHAHSLWPQPLFVIHACEIVRACLVSEISNHNEINIAHFRKLALLTFSKLYAYKCNVRVDTNETQSFQLYM